MLWNKQQSLKKFILRLATKLCQPVGFKENRFIRNIDLKVGAHPGDEDGPVRTLLAQIGYHSELGARSLEQVIERLVKHHLFNKELEGDEVVDDEVDKGPLTLYRVDHLSTGEQDQEAVMVRRLASSESRSAW